MFKEKIEISRDEMLRYLGYQGQTLSPRLKADVAWAQDEVLRLSEPLYVYKQTEREALLADPATARLLSGEDIRNHLGDCPEVIFLAATLGHELDFAIRRLQQTDISRALLLDSAGSVAIEEWVNYLEDALREAQQQQGKMLSTRFSPGYGDYPLDIQGDLIRYLDGGRKIGLALTGDQLMQPLKSITCVLGLRPLGEHFGAIADPCSICIRRGDCPLRRRGGYCGKFRS